MRWLKGNIIGLSEEEAILKINNSLELPEARGLNHYTFEFILQGGIVTADYQLSRIRIILDPRTTRVIDISSPG